jgi:hypothetical protein
MIVRHIDRDGHVRRHYIGVTYVRSISDCMLYLTKTDIEQEETDYES